MIDIIQYQKSTSLKEYCVFRFAFNFIGTVNGLDIVSYFYTRLLANQQNVVSKGLIRPFIAQHTPFATPMKSEYRNTIFANTYNIINTEIDSTGSCLFDYAEFSNQQILLPETRIVTTVMSVVIKTYFDILSKFPNLSVQHKFDFQSTKPTYFYPIYDCWGNDYCPFDNALIKHCTTYIEILDASTTPYDVLKRFFEQFEYPFGYQPQFVTSNRQNVETVWNDIFK